MSEPIIKLVHELYEIYKIEQPGRPQTALAEALGVSQSYVNKWVTNGKTMSAENAARVYAHYKEKTGNDPGVPIDTIKVVTSIQTDPFIKEISSIMSKMSKKQKEMVVATVKGFATAQGINI